MTIVTTRAHGRTIIAGRPDGSTDGTLSLDMAELFGRAAEARASVCVLRPAAPVNEALFALTVREGQPIERAAPSGWLRARCTAATAARALEVRRATAGESAWLEMYRELRRHIGDERLPYPLRTRLRGLADRSFARSTRAGARRARYARPRRALRTPVATMLPPVLADEARARAAAFGVPLDAPIVALDARVKPALVRDAVETLLADGFVVVRLGLGSPMSSPGVINLAMSGPRSPALDVLVLLQAAFLVCGSADLQHVSYLTGTPCLRLGAHDPVAAYPIRVDGLFTLASAVELETGRTLSIDELLSEAYLKHPERFGHRPNTPAEIVAAVREMQQGVSEGWSESDGQTRVRTRALGAAQALAPRAPGLLACGPDDGFIGDGRLARVQADRLS